MAFTFLVVALSALQVSIAGADLEGISSDVFQEVAHGRSLAQTNGGRSGQLSRVSPCSWTVFYNQWIPSFSAGEYEHPGSLGGAHCLQACCEDPNCKGLQLMSNEMYQCYKYTSVPTEVGLEHGRGLGDGEWLRHMKPAWSIFAKVGGAALPPNQLVTASAGKECGWAVHYDLWLDTFSRGEYEPANSFGGAHCLTACCHDPDCNGLALMSNEEYQCYKYKKLPNALASRQGMPLGDGQWILKKRPAWSVFVKTSSPHHARRIESIFAPGLPQAPQSPEALPVSQASNLHTGGRTHSLRVGGMLNHIARPVAPAPMTNVVRTMMTSFFHIVVLVATIAALVLIVARQATPELLAIFRGSFTSFSEQGDPEKRKLLEGIDLKNMGDGVRKSNKAATLS